MELTYPSTYQFVSDDILLRALHSIRSIDEREQAYFHHVLMTAAQIVGMICSKKIKSKKQLIAQLKKAEAFIKKERHSKNLCQYHPKVSPFVNTTHEAFDREMQAAIRWKNGNWQKTILAKHWIVGNFDFEHIISFSDLAAKIDDEIRYVERHYMNINDIPLK